MKLINEIFNMMWQLEYPVLLNENIDKTLVKEIEREHYLERIENWKIEGDESDPHGTEMKSAYSIVDDSYIGPVKFAKMMVKKGLSKFQVAEDGHNVSSIAFNEGEQKWSGWSHRAISSFGIGDMLFDEEFGKDLEEEIIDKMPFIKRGSIKIVKLEQAKTAASNFASHVS